MTSELCELTSVSTSDELRRRVLWAVPTLLGVLGTVARDGVAHLMNISWVVPVANEPTRLAISVESNSLSAKNLHEQGAWALTLLDVDDRALGRAFVKAQRTWQREGDVESVDGHDVRRASNGAPYLSTALAVLAGPATLLAPLEEHELWLGVVVEVAARAEVTSGAASEHGARVLGVHDTRMNYGR